MTPKRVAFCLPTLTRPFQCTLDSLAASVPLIQAAGWDDCMVSEVGSPYISHARAAMLRKALDAKADVIVFIDHDLSWDAQDLLTLIEAKGDVVAGTYRFKHEPEEYMGSLIPDIHGKPQIRADGGLKAFCVPAGFLKITGFAVNKLMKAFPELMYGNRFNPSIDLFNHGAFEWVWYGEDYAFSRRWNTIGEIVLLPNLNINHHTKDAEFKGNYHRFLMTQPGGSECSQ